MISQKKIWTTSAPSNIALIKYMGKFQNEDGKPANVSLSLTLPHLLSFVQLELDPSLSSDQWSPLKSFEGKEFSPIQLSEKGRTRYLAHFRKIKEHFKFQGSFVVRSANDFPSDCGLASSASSFAALTKVAMTALAEVSGQKTPPASEMAEWSRRGSGSSCRSFFAPWSVWTKTEVRDVPELNQAQPMGLFHQVIVVNDEMKLVSSSEAHRRVTTSLLFHGRPERAEARVRDLILALQTDQWQEAFEITWAEFWDMHALFETSRPSFGYLTGGSLDVLNFVKRIWDDLGDGPLATMDAGANVHLIYRNNEVGRQAASKMENAMGGRYTIFQNVVRGEK